MEEMPITRPGNDHSVAADAAPHTFTARISIGTLPRAADAATFAVPGRVGTCAHCATSDSVPPDDAYIPDDLYGPENPDDPCGPRFVSEQDQWDAELDELLGRNRYSRVDDREWEEWHGIDQDEAERALLALEAPAWVSLPPGGALVAELEGARPQEPCSVHDDGTVRAR